MFYLLDQPVNTCRFFKKTWVPAQINDVIVLAQVLPGNPENAYKGNAVIVALPDTSISLVFQSRFPGK